MYTFSRRILWQTLVSVGIAVFFCCVAVSAAQAQESLSTSPIMRGLDYIRSYSGLPAANLQLVFAKLIRLALSFVGIILLFIIIYSGLLWMTSGGDEEKIAKAKASLMSAIIGIIIIIAAYSIVLFIFELFEDTGSVQSPLEQTPSTSPPGT